MAAASPTKLVCFYLNDQEYAARISDVKETLTIRPISRVFLTPEWVAGIINLRGDVVAVLDLSLMLGMRPTRPDDASRILIARVGELRAGIIVDRMAELRDLDLSELQPPPPTLSSDAAALMLGITTVEDSKPLRVLDLHHLFETERLREFRRV